MKRWFTFLIVMVLVVGAVSTAVAGCPEDLRFPPRANYSPSRFRCAVKTCRVWQRRYGDENVTGSYFQSRYDGTTSLIRLVVNWEQTYVDYKNHYKTRSGAYFYPWVDDSKG